MRNEAERCFEEGLVYIEQEEYNSAISSLCKAVEINPNFFEAWFRLGVAYKYKRDYEKALICNIKGWEINQNSPIENDIFECYNELIELNSKNFKVWYKMGDFQSKIGMYEKAIESYDRTIDILRRSNSSIKLNKIHTKKGIAFYNIGELDSAINCYNRALEIDSTDDIARKYKIELLKELKKKKRCSKCGAPLNFKVGQLVGKRLYVIMDIDDLRFLMLKVKSTVDSKPSYEYEKFKKIEEKYKKINDEVY